jgi:hypothetical protein
MSAYRTPVALPVFHPCRHPFSQEKRMDEVTPQDTHNHCSCTECGAERGICAFAGLHDWEDRYGYGELVCTVCGAT